MKNRVLADIYFDPELSVWRLAGGQSVPYSDGKCTEAYLRKVLDSASDLSSTGHELERHILDWPSEYHLSRKRSRLLSGFHYDRRLKVLEVGCGCGAVTRFLGETFDDVVAVEGSAERAAIARLRTRDQKNVSIIAGPFQAIQFSSTFDIVFCIGVLEYARMFVDARDPYDRVMDYFESILSPNGMLVLAIENQFGLKYFSSCPEDHTGVMFDGIEGYHRNPYSARTFGYGELKQRLEQRFAGCDFYFPYPDYKTPSCILSEELLHKTDASEVIGAVASASYSSRIKPLFDERLALTELARNHVLQLFANSFLVLARKHESSIMRDWLGILYGTDHRRPELQTCMEIVDDAGCVSVRKRLLSGEEAYAIGKVRLNSSYHPWLEGCSLQLELIKQLRNRKNTLSHILEPTLPWYEKLQSLARVENGVRWLDGKYIDAIWRNTFISNGEARFIDLEWEWAEEIPFNYVILRALLYFFQYVAEEGVIGAKLGHRSMWKLIRDACQFYGLRISVKDFRYLLSTEAELCCTITSEKAIKHRYTFSLIRRLFSRPGVTPLGVTLRRKKAALRGLLGTVKAKARPMSD